MFDVGFFGQHDHMQLIIEVAESDPPTGTVTLGPTAAVVLPAEPAAFVGWLGLLRALHEIIGSPHRDQRGDLKQAD